jgi:hypothetical protein
LSDAPWGKFELGVSWILSQRYFPSGSSVEYVLKVTMLRDQLAGRSIQRFSLEKEGLSEYPTPDLKIASAVYLTPVTHDASTHLA